jgi:hypothetical protein
MPLQVEALNKDLFEAVKLAELAKTQQQALERAQWEAEAALERTRRC